jgi:sugar/nucleoside kinase (ribokinase family)
MNEAITLLTELKVFENFQPTLPDHYRQSPYVFLANIDPELQFQVLDQVEKPRLVGADTMNFWIASKLEALHKVMSRVDVLLINEGEAKLLSKQANAIAAARGLLNLGPKAVVIKRGEYGFVLYTKEGFFILPAFPVADVVDPTGAGDTFAGGFFGHLAKTNSDLTLRHLKEACVNGCLMASMTLEGFGVTSLKDVTKSHIDERLAQYMEVISF